MDRTICIRCGGTMSHVGTEKLQLGQAGLFMGLWNNILAGSMEVEIYACADCSKLEFYANTENSTANDTDDLPQAKCPRCGKMYDFDYPKCPFCDYTYQSIV